MLDLRSQDCSVPQGACTCVPFSACLDNGPDGAINCASDGHSDLVAGIVASLHRNRGHYCTHKQSNRVINKLARFFVADIQSSVWSTTRICTMIAKFSRTAWIFRGWRPTAHRSTASRQPPASVAPRAASTVLLSRCNAMSWSEPCENYPTRTTSSCEIP